jgi:hypothetical protein
MRVASLFSGAGGLDLGLEQVDMFNRAYAAATWVLESVFCGVDVRWRCRPILLSARATPLWSRAGRPRGGDALRERPWSQTGRPASAPAPFPLCPPPPLRTRGGGGAPPPLQVLKNAFPGVPIVEDVASLLSLPRVSVPSLAMG